MKRMAWVLALSLALILTGGQPRVEGETLTGKLIGEECAKRLKLTDCYLEYAYPMVLFTDEGEYYRLKLGGVDQLELDKAFGKRVEISGTLEGRTIRVRRLKVLEPVGEPEFFKGCL